MKDSASMRNLFAHELKETSAWKEYVWQLLLCPLKKRNKDIVKACSNSYVHQDKKRVWGSLRNR